MLNNGKIFQPFELNANFDDPLSDSDPDLQFYNSQCNNVLNSCDYYLENSFNKKLKELDVKDGAFSMIHFNVRSAPKNLGSFENYLST